MKHCKMLCLVCVAFVLALSGCDNEDSADATSSTDSDSSSDSSTDLGPFASATPEMLSRSLISLGNNFRMKKLIDKVAQNQPVTIGYIGGSITEAYTTTSEESYVVGSYEKFVERFAAGNGANIHYYNGGMGGTPSTLGMLRYEPEILGSAPTPPDLVVVEFAVNDYDDTTDGASYESLVRKILLSDHQPAVLLLFSVFRDEQNLEDRMIPIGNQYQLPMISIKQAVVPELQAGTIAKGDFFRDKFHPTAWGFQIMTETIDYYFEQVAAAQADSSDIVLPETPVIGFQFADIRALTPSTTDANVTLNVGSFTEVDSVQRAYEWSNGTKKTYEENWHKGADATNAPFTLSGTFKNLVLAYKVSGDSSFGTAEAYIDGQLWRTIKGYSANGWNKPTAMVIMDEETAAPHTFELKMAAGDEAKLFTIDVLGYTP